MLGTQSRVIAGEGIGGIKIGASEHELLQLLPENVGIEILEHATLYTSKPWKIWVDTKTQKLPKSAWVTALRENF